MSQGSTDAEANEAEDDTDSSKLSMHSVQNALSAFRQEWQRELGEPNTQFQPCHTNRYTTQQQQFEDKEEKAKNLFCKGIEYERSGNMYEAILYYRKAVQIIPDIEFRMYDDIQKSSNDEINKTPSYESSHIYEYKDLLSHIKNTRSVTDPICLQNKEQTFTHFSQLPVEVIFYILRWVVSNELDLRSLEQCAAVCRGFYILCRDGEIWKTACVRTWGINCGVLKNSPYTSWRQMIIERPRLKFDGCYISKTTYFRYGENNFQDQFYRPWHLIEYYRYLRFFPGGKVLMLTTPDEPINVVYTLKNWTTKNSAIMSGHYRIQQDRVILVVKRTRIVTNKAKELGRQRRRKEAGLDTGEQTFQVELQINSPQKRNSIQLSWFGYKVFCKYYNGTETQSTFDLVSSRYPPFWFSRVKSFHADSEYPLQ